MDSQNTLTPVLTTRTLGRLSAYGLAAFGVAGSASAAVVSADLGGQTFLDDYFSGDDPPAAATYDLDGDGVNDVQFNLRDFGGDYQVKQFQIANGGSGGVFTNQTGALLGNLRVDQSTTPQYVNVFSNGDVIGASTAADPDVGLQPDPTGSLRILIDDFAGYYVSGETPGVYSSPENRPYPSLASGALGFSFVADLNGAATTHFGYAVISYDDALASPVSVEGIFFESTPGASIIVSGGDPIPEPGSLALLAAGAVGLAGYRRRRAA